MKHFLKALGVNLIGLLLLSGFLALFGMSPQPVDETLEFFVRYSPITLVLAAMYANFKKP